MVLDIAPFTGAQYRFTTLEVAADINVLEYNFVPKTHCF